MSAPRVYADFQNLDDENRVRLDRVGTLQDLRDQGIELREGLVLLLYTDDGDDEGNPDELRVDGVVRFDAKTQTWVAEVDWIATRHASDDARGAGEGSRNGAGHPAAGEAPLSKN